MVDSLALGLVPPFGVGSNVVIVIPRGSVVFGTTPCGLQARLVGCIRAGLLAGSALWAPSMIEVISLHRIGMHSIAGPSPFNLMLFVFVVVLVGT